MTFDHSNPGQDQEAQPAQQANDNHPSNPQEASNNGTPKSKPPVKLIGIGIVAILVLVVLFSLLNNGDKSSPITEKQPILRFSIDERDTVIMNGQSFELDGHMWDISDSLDSSAAAMLTYDESSDESMERNTLWYLNSSDKPIQVAEYVGNYNISDNGTKVAYIADVDEEYGTLYLFDGKKSEVIDHDVYAWYMHMSPDGNSIVYLKDSEELSAYVKNGSKAPEKLGDFIYPFAVANDAKYIYYMELDEEYLDYEDDSEAVGHLYVQKGKNPVRLRSNISLEDMTLLFNEDYSQVLITEDDRTYLSIEGGESTPVTRSELVYTVQDIASRSWGLPDYSWWKDSFRVFADRDLTGTLLHNDSGDIVTIDRSGNSETLVSEAWNAYVTDVLNTVVYIDDRDRLIRRSLKNPGEEAEILSRDAMFFLTTDDVKTIYYVDSNYDLYVIKGKAEPKLLMMSVDYPIDLTPDGQQIMFLADYRNEGGSLYISKNGGEPKILDEDVFTLILTDEGMYYAKDYYEGSFDLYFTSDYSKSELIAREAESLRY